MHGIYEYFNEMFHLIYIYIFFNFRVARNKLNQRNIKMCRDQDGESKEINLLNNCETLFCFLLCDTYMYDLINLISWFHRFSSTMVFSITLSIILRLKIGHSVFSVLKVFNFYYWTIRVFVENDMIYFDTS